MLLPEIHDREEAKQALIQKIGPWAFQSFSRKKWPNAPDRLIIEGALLQAMPEDRYELLKIYSLDQIKDVWEKYVVIQDDWHHASNVWAAQHIFKVSDPEKFVRQQARKFRKQMFEKGFDLSV
jgi:hypothetical protein